MKKFIITFFGIVFLLPDFAGNIGLPNEPFFAGNIGLPNEPSFAGNIGLPIASSNPSSSRGFSSSRATRSGNFASGTRSLSADRSLNVRRGGGVTFIGSLEDTIASSNPSSSRGFSSNRATRSGNFSSGTRSLSSDRNSFGK